MTRTRHVGSRIVPGRHAVGCRQWGRLWLCGVRGVWQISALHLSFTVSLKLPHDLETGVTGPEGQAVRKGPSVPQSPGWSARGGSIAGKPVMAPESCAPREVPLPDGDIEPAHSFSVRVNGTGVWGQEAGSSLRTRDAEHDSLGFARPRIQG